MNTWQKLKQQPKLFKRYFVREQIFAAIREFFAKKQTHEVEVPLLAPSLPAESYLEVFETTLLDRHRHPKRAFLTTSPEMFLKKLLVAGIGSCFSLTKSFRNTEGESNTHNPEFTILEWYEVGKDYKDVMKTTEELVCYIYDKLFSSSVARSDHNRHTELVSASKKSSLIRSNSKLILNYQNQVIDLTPPWERISMTEAFAKYARIDLEKLLDLKSLQTVVRKKGYQVGEGETWEELFHQIYLNEVVPQFSKNRPTIIFDYPVQLAALAAKPKASDPRFVERFEVYIGGIELADCCTELTQVDEQQKRFQKELTLRKKLGKKDYPVDWEFIEALKLGLPSCAGIALGVDRLVMLMTNVSRIQDTLFFPSEEMWQGLS